MLLMVIVLIGGVGAAFLLLQAFSGPSASKSVKRRMELLKERHADGALAANAQAQIRKLLSQRANGGAIESWFSTIVPKPALLRKRLEMTGKEISLGKYAMICAGLFACVVAGLALKGFPIILAFFLGLFVGIGLPHFVIGKMINRRIAKFNSNFPDAIELMTTSRSDTTTTSATSPLRT